MRLYSSMVIAGSLTLFYPALECQAQIFPQPDRLEALFPCSGGAAESTRCNQSARPIDRPPSDWVNSSPYYKVVVDNICKANVENLAQTWLGARFRTFRDRAIEVRASIGYRDQSGNRPRAHQTILATGNLIDSPQFCQPSVIRGILRTEDVNVTLQLYVADENGPKTKAAIKSGLSAGTSAAVGFVFGGPFGAGAVGALGAFLGGTTEAFGAKSNHTEFVNKKAKVFETRELLLGRSVQAHYGYFVGNGQDSFTVHQEAQFWPPVYEEPESSPGMWRPVVAELWKNPPARTPVSVASRSPTSVQASQRQARRAEKTSVAQNGWWPGFPVSAQAPAPQTRRAEKTSVAQNERWQAPGFSAGALAAPPAALPRTTLAYR